MRDSLGGKTGKLLVAILLMAITAGIIPSPADRNGSSLTLQPARVEAAQADFDTDTLADILYLFDIENNKYARLKTRFIENFEKLSPESRNKVIQMYLGGKKEQPDKLLQMKGMSATASFLRGVDVAQNIIHEYQTTGKIKEDGDFTGIASGTAILEYFPKTSVQLIPILANPADVKKLVDMMGKVISDSTAKNRADADKYKADAEESAKRTAIIKEINDMLEAALRK